MPLNKEEQDALIELVRKAAKAEIMPRFRSLSSDGIRQSPPPTIW